MTEAKQLTATKVLVKGSWHGEAADCVVLDYDDRFRRRILLATEAGLEILLSLPDAQLLNSGDALETETGELIEVVAAAEKLIEIRCANAHELLRTAWHLGNRHLATEILGETLRIRFDKVILEMVEGLGTQATVIDAPFNPEGGAYAGGQTRVHSHDHHHHHH
jgi:urease accessory protein